VGNIYEFGGSSAASPQWAAIIALADQAGTAGSASEQRLYSLAHGSRYGYVFHDVSAATTPFRWPLQQRGGADHRLPVG